MVAASKAFFFWGRLMVTKTTPSTVESIRTRSSFASGAGSATSGWAMRLISAASASVMSRAFNSASVGVSVIGGSFRGLNVWRKRRLQPFRYIRNTPKVVSGIGAFRLALMARPSTSRVWAGSMTPSSHRRAVA